MHTTDPEAPASVATIEDDLPFGPATVHEPAEPDLEERKQVCSRCGILLVRYDPDVDEDILSWWDTEASVATFPTRGGSRATETDADPDCIPREPPETVPGE